VTAVDGSFSIGDVVRIADGQGREVGRGVCRYSHDDLTRIMGQSSPAVTKILGIKAQEVIHRDDLVLM